MFLIVLQNFYLVNTDLFNMEIIAMLNVVYSPLFSVSWDYANYYNEY